MFRKNTKNLLFFVNKSHVPCSNEDTDTHILKKFYSTFLLMMFYRFSSFYWFWFDQLYQVNLLKKYIANSVLSWRKKHWSYEYWLEYDFLFLIYFCRIQHLLANFNDYIENRSDFQINDWSFLSILWVISYITLFVINIIHNISSSVMKSRKQLPIKIAVKWIAISNRSVQHINLTWSLVICIYSLLLGFSSTIYFIAVLCSRMFIWLFITCTIQSNRISVWKWIKIFFEISFVLQKSKLLLLKQNSRWAHIEMEKMKNQNDWCEREGWR